ncbi:response regulator [candidate division CSSED10-310 bacterium]|uniref:Response regulator n=1 Tax=candidate division CSSED10-310 bacterium TaxID=2855610 RepID=A0ABV6Z6X2_UNCC1
MDDKNIPPKRILIVDDEVNIRELIITILSDYNYIMEQAPDGKEAVKKVLSFQPDLIILDYMMPDMTGREVLHHKTVKSREIPCIILTGKGSEEIAVTMLREGAFDYLTKPFLAQELIQAVENAIELRFITSDKNIYVHNEFLWLKRENNFLKEQLHFMRKVLLMDREGDLVLDNLSKELIDIDVSQLPKDEKLLKQQLNKLKEMAKKHSQTTKEANT